MKLILPGVVTCTLIVSCVSSMSPVIEFFAKEDGTGYDILLIRFYIRLSLEWELPAWDHAVERLNQWSEQPETRKTKRELFVKNYKEGMENFMVTSLTYMDNEQEYKSKYKALVNKLKNKDKQQSESKSKTKSGTKTSKHKKKSKTKTKKKSRKQKKKLENKNKNESSESDDSGDCGDEDSSYGDGDSLEPQFDRYTDGMFGLSFFFTTLTDGFRFVDNNMWSCCFACLTVL